MQHWSLEGGMGAGGGLFEKFSQLEIRLEHYTNTVNIEKRKILKEAAHGASTKYC